MDIGRRAFLRGQRLRGIVAMPYRPPWAGDEKLFTHACTRCGACIAACPTGLLAQGAGGFPEANFQRAHCTFCADCAHACAENARKSAPSLPLALAFSPDLPPWELRAEIGAACLPRRGALCRSCEDHCEEGAIRFALRQGNPAQPEVTKLHCTGCGECVASCPVHAIAMQRTLLSSLRPTPIKEKTTQ